MSGSADLGFAGFFSNLTKDNAVLCKSRDGLFEEDFFICPRVIASDRRERSPSSLKCFHVQLRRDLAEAKHNMYLAKAGNLLNSKKIASSSL